MTKLKEVMEKLDLNNLPSRYISEYAMNDEKTSGKPNLNTPEQQIKKQQYFSKLKQSTPKTAKGFERYQEENKSIREKRETGVFALMVDGKMKIGGLTQSDARKLIKLKKKSEPALKWSIQRI